MRRDQRAGGKPGEMVVVEAGQTVFQQGVWSAAQKPVPRGQRRCDWKVSLPAFAAFTVGWPVVTPTRRLPYFPAQ